MYLLNAEALSDGTVISLETPSVAVTLMLSDGSLLNVFGDGTGDVSFTDGTMKPINFRP
jgi:hypothetical protein